MWDVISGTIVQILYSSWEYFYEIHVKCVSRSESKPELQWNQGRVYVTCKLWNLGGLYLWGMNGTNIEVSCSL